MSHTEPATFYTLEQGHTAQQGTITDAERADHSADPQGFGLIRHHIESWLIEQGDTPADANHQAGRALADIERRGYGAVQPTEGDRAMIVEGCWPLAETERERVEIDTDPIATELIRLGWEQVAIWLDPASDNYPRRGLVAFSRHVSDQRGPYGTAALFIARDGSVSFEHGHYDLALNQCREDFSARVAQGL